MAKLILSFEGAMLKTVELNKERTTIGRRPDNDIQVDNLAVSGLHAAVTTVLNDSVIEDLDSTNGTLVNGELTQKHLLKHGDIIEIGKHTIKYVIDATTAKPYQDFAKTMVIRRPDAAAHGSHSPRGEHAIPLNQAPTGASKAENFPDTRPLHALPPAVAQEATHDATTEAPLANREAALKILSGPSTGRMLDLNKSLTTIGKAGVQVAVFTRRPNGFFVTHVEGVKFPLVNEESVGTQATQLNDQDVIEIAGTKMCFVYKS